MFEKEDFFYRNDAGFLADLDIHEEGVFIFDEFLELLEELKNFLVENGR